MLFKNCWGSMGCWWTFAYLHLVFIKVQWLQIILRATQTLMFWFFSKKVLSNVWYYIDLVRQHLFYQTISLGFKICIYIYIYIYIYSGQQYYLQQCFDYLIFWFLMYRWLVCKAFSKDLTFCYANADV